MWRNWLIPYILPASPKLKDENIGLNSVYLRVLTLYLDNVMPLCWICSNDDYNVYIVIISTACIQSATTAAANVD